MTVLSYVGCLATGNQSMCEISSSIFWFYLFHCTVID
jgi:hypothetical protein